MSDGIAYMNQFDKIKLIDPSYLFDLYSKPLLNIDEFKLFVSKCVNLDCVDSFRKQLIHYACIDNNLDMVKCLVENGADINVKTNDGKLPSDLTDNEEILRLLR